ncbi:hypothetical protein ABFY54_08465 [Priestia megaterium]|uniref:hypothetical protein n=1 Tax=Priestia megaterium TaxID=1404 RepID=UPI001DBDC24B|nr:hypothetical protein [Priestia megaterium]
MKRYSFYIEKERFYEKNKHQISTSSTTDVEEIKRLNAQSGLTYNEVFALLGENYLKNQQKK